MKGCAILVERWNGFCFEPSEAREIDLDGSLPDLVC